MAGSKAEAQHFDTFVEYSGRATILYVRCLTWGLRGCWMANTKDAVEDAMRGNI